MNKEIDEILKYLEKREDYIIWAGFAGYIHLGIKCSDDVDIFIDSPAKIKSISSEFKKRGWRMKSKSKSARLEKKGTTFDILYSRNAEILFSSAVKLKYKNYCLRTVSKEGLYISKLGQLSSENRIDEKRKRDVKTINQLRKLIRLLDLKKLIKKLPDSYWIKGHF